MPRKKKIHIYRMHKKSKLEKTLIFSQLMRFFRENITEDSSITKNELLLFYGLLQEFDKAGWLDRITVSCTILARHMRTTNKKNILIARKSLVERGYIRYDHGPKNSKNRTYYYLDILEGLIDNADKENETES